ncbi:hypothetical protein [Rhodopirellula halodulae]|uniref:hypothetical protein n=1 Tax=Rhodopirellula halodulae TaxID=2894198 RepID=UPI001E5A6FA8|nr:hypothetical protein [Rhodopirellula sp. JC737]MCC9655266.1 hypothetical protein [Rhodopirellula sp. JC737]
MKSTDLAAFFNLICILAMATPCVASDSNKLRHRWNDRLEAELAELSDEDQEHPRNILIVSKASAGEIEEAISIVSDVVPRERRAEMLGYVAACQAQAGELRGATETVNLIASSVSRQFAWKRVIQVLASVRRLDDARNLLKHLDEISIRDDVLALLALAHAKEGAFEVASETAETISSKDIRNDVAAKIRTVRGGEINPIEKLKRGYIRDQISVLTAFSGPNAYREPILAIAAAQNGDAASLDRLAKAATDDAGTSLLEPRLSTTSVLLAVAFANSGNTAKAKRLINAGYEASGRDDRFGTVNAFGSPILVYLMIQLEMQQLLLEDFARTRSEGGRTSEQTLQAMGAAFAELERLESGEEIYKTLRNPVEKSNFCVGVLTGLDYLQRTKP